MVKGPKKPAPDLLEKQPDGALGRMGARPWGECWSPDARPQRQGLTPFSRDTQAFFSPTCLGHSLQKQRLSAHSGQALSPAPGSMVGWKAEGFRLRPESEHPLSGPAHDTELLRLLPCKTPTPPRSLSRLNTYVPRGHLHIGDIQLS